jgi:hypothetical protein
VIGDCGNCGSTGEQLAPVHRVYLIPEHSRLDDIEFWCVSCRTQYPHEEPGDAAG